VRPDTSNGTSLLHFESKGSHAGMPMPIILVSESFDTSLILTDVRLRSCSLRAMKRFCLR
jgi:hypothetical protein